MSFKCVLKSKTGQFISSTYNREVLTAIGSEQLGPLSGLAKNLKNLKKGEKRTIAVSAEEAYGLYDLTKVVIFPKKRIPASSKKGDFVQIMSKTGVVRSYRILEVHSDFVSLDGNHPLAGQDLVFEIETLEARDATSREIEESQNTVVTQHLH